MTSTKEDNKKKINFVGIATLITALTAIPSVLLNTYLDFRERNNSELVQESSYTNTANAIKDLSGDIDKAMSKIAELQREVYELKGYIRGRMHETSRPRNVEIEEKSEAIDPVKVKRKPMADFNDIVQHVQNTGEVYTQEKPMEAAAAPTPSP